MKTIQKFLLSTICLATGLLCSCTDYQDEIDALDYRVTVLENLVRQMNSELESMQVIIQAVDGCDYITNVTENSEGYIITFAHSGAIVIHDGKDGKDGQDAKVPDITVEKAEDGYYYWVINGTWLTDGNGELVKAVGKDGKDGQDGQDGKAIAPQLQINSETSIWEISTDGGNTWVSTGTVATGKDGKDGKDANNIVSVVTHWNEGYVEFITSSGTFRVPLDDQH